MVFAAGRLSRTALAQRLRISFGLAPGIRREGWISQREFARRTGVPRSTIQDFIRNPERSRVGTVDRIEAGASRSNVVGVADRVTTRSIDAPLFTDRSLDNIVFPEGSTSFRLIVQDETYAGGYRTTMDFDLETESVLSAIQKSGLDSSSVARVIIDLGR